MTFHRIYNPERLHELIDAILLIESDASLHDLLKAIVKAATQLVGARYGAMGVIASDGKTLSRFITYGIDETTRTRIGQTPHGAGLLGEIVASAQPLRVEDLSIHEKASGFPANHPHMTSFLGVPVKTGDGRVFGNFYITDRINGEPFSEEDEILVESFGRAAGLIIDQATIRSHLRELTLSEERERLARDLHDTVIQRLFGVGLALQITLPMVSDDKIQARINSAIDELDETIREIRTTIFEIDQEEADGATLMSRIAALVQEVGTRLGIKVDLKVSEEINQEVDNVCARHTTQALREILSNIVRHSEATRVEVDLSGEGDFLVLKVHDNGVGFDGGTGFGRGLRNLSTRANDLGGECVIESSVGSGTLVTWTALKRA
ncbi:MAG TPA: GAF domain-containing sensor histidine kinase [Acidimicrobiales bacterium]